MERRRPPRPPLKWNMNVEIFNSPPLVEIDQLTKIYGTFTAVSDLTLNVGRGELFALLGPNGAGKTTTIRMLMAFSSRRAAGHESTA